VSKAHGLLSEAVVGNLLVVRRVRNTTNCGSAARPNPARIDNRSRWRIPHTRRGAVRVAEKILAGETVGTAPAVVGITLATRTRVDSVDIRTLEEHYPRALAVELDIIAGLSLVVAVREDNTLFANHPSVLPLFHVFDYDQAIRPEWAVSRRTVVSVRIVRIQISKGPCNSRADHECDAS